MNNDFKCPICGGPMSSRVGNQMFPDNPAYGITVWCPKFCIDTDAHGKNEQVAFDVFVQKCGKTEKKN